MPAWLTLDSPPPPLLLWTLGSILVFALGSNLLWLTWDRRRLAAPFGAPLLQAGRFLYYLGVPYLVLGGWPLPPYRGLLAPVNLGIAGFDSAWNVARWLEAAGTGVSVGLFALGFVTVVWLNANRREGSTRLRLSATSAWPLLVDGLYLQVHWAFYRGALAVLFGDLYVGVFWGLALVHAEWLTSPFWRGCWRREERAGDAWLLAVQSLVSALLFLLTHNLWVCLAVHWALSLAVWALARKRPEYDNRPHHSEARSDEESRVRGSGDPSLRSG